MSKLVVSDPWKNLRALTPARIALGRAGAALPTKDVLSFALDHARAHDAVQEPLNAAAVESAIRALGFDTLTVRSAAPNRSVYLRRPDTGRKIYPDDAPLLKSRGAHADIVFIVADGLSSAAIHMHTTPLLRAAKPHLERNQLRVGPIVIASQARVALGDEIASLLGARICVTLIGERPGLSSPDSLGAYITLDPKIGRTDAERNCISNIRPAGLGYDGAAQKLFWLIEEGLRIGKTGIALKDMSDLTALPK